MTQIIYADEADDILDADATDILACMPFYSGEEFSTNFAYYASDDEVLDQDVLDEVAYANWREEIDIEE